MSWRDPISVIEKDTWDNYNLLCEKKWLPKKLKSSVGRQKRSWFNNYGLVILLR